MGSFEANGIRALGAVIAFLLLKPSSMIHIYRDVQKMTSSKRFELIGASLLGTFISLSLYLKALKTAHVASLTAISITGPIWVSIIEHIRMKKLPNRYLWIAFAFFLTGFMMMSKSLIH
jgi:drug/metabolite transporter (DMT)-like permease